MALPKKKKGWRKIVVEEQEFMWMPATLVYPLVSQLTKLIIDSDFHDPWLAFPDSVENNPKNITPKYVAEAIKFALEAGWEPSTHRGKFEIKYLDGKFQTVNTD